MISLLLAVLLVISGGISVGASPLVTGPSQGIKSAVTPINTSGMPVRINTATLEDSVSDSWLDYSISNISGEDIRDIELRVFVADSEGKLVKAKEGFSAARIAAGATQNDRTRIKGIAGAQSPYLVAVSKVVTTLGVWQVDTSASEKAIRERLNRKPEVTIRVSFEPHLIISDSDRAQILELALRDIVHDGEKTERLLGTSQLIVLGSSVNFPLPRIPGKELLALNRDEIQAIAERVKRVVFLTYQPLTVEGSRVLARIGLRDAVTRRRSIRVQYKYTFLFTCVKQNGRWIIEKSIGYAQS